MCVGTQNIYILQADPPEKKPSSFALAMLLLNLVKTLFSALSFFQSLPSSFVVKIHLAIGLITFLPHFDVFGSLIP
jgi:hypothetical protein